MKRLYLDLEVIKIQINWHQRKFFLKGFSRSTANKVLGSFFMCDMGVSSHPHYFITGLVWKTAEGK